MVNGDEVKRVAELARLALGEGESERMAGQLSGILDHVARIGELALDGVEPTTHVVALENVLRADTPRPSLERGAALAGAPDFSEGAFRVPSPQA